MILIMSFLLNPPIIRKLGHIALGVFIDQRDDNPQLTIADPIHPPPSPVIALEPRRSHGRIGLTADGVRPAHIAPAGSS
jgi:hypothetical protein